MNPLMDALKLAGDPGRASATPDVDFSPDHRFFGDRPLEPARTTRGDTGPAGAAPAVPDAGESSRPGRVGRMAARTDPRDEGRHGRARSRCRVRSAPTRLRRRTRPIPVRLPTPKFPAGPIRAMDHDSDVPEGHVHPSSHERSDAGESAPAAFGAFDPRNLRRGPGVARIAGIALSLLAVVAAAAGGGYFVWKTEFVRPALSRASVPGRRAGRGPDAGACGERGDERGRRAGRECSAPGSTRLRAPRLRKHRRRRRRRCPPRFPTQKPRRGPKGTPPADLGPRRARPERGQSRMRRPFISERPVASPPMQAAEIPGSGRPEQMAVPDSRAVTRTFSDVLARTCGADHCRTPEIALPRPARRGRPRRRSRRGRR